MDNIKTNFDPTFLHARREALFILALFVVCFIWSIGVYYFDGYYPEGNIPAQVPTVWGMPRWVFWGIFVPWVLVDVVTVWFVFFYMKDDDLGEESGIAN